jgi:hypothetical protein
VPPAAAGLARRARIRSECATDRRLGNSHALYDARNDRDDAAMLRAWASATAGPAFAALA